MKRILNHFLTETKLIKSPVNSTNSKKMQKLSKENKYLLYGKHYTTLIIPTEASSFYTHYHSYNTLSIAFYNKLGNQISTLLLKNANREELEKFLFSQLIRSK